MPPSQKSSPAFTLPPGPRSRIPGRVFKQLRKNPLAFLTANAQKFGDIFSFSALGQTYIVLNHPDLVKEVLLTQAQAFWKGPALQNSKGTLGEGLLTAEGDAHKHQRRLITPAFHAKHVESYSQIVLDHTHNLITQIQKSPAKSPIDIRPHMMQLTLLIAGQALFGTLLENEIAQVSHSMEVLLGNFVRSVVPWGKLLMKLPLPSSKKIKAAQKNLSAIIQKIITARRTETKDSALSTQDLLSTMIAATDPESPRPLTDKQLADNAVTILTAGHETTANAMTFTLYLLAKHPAEQSRLRQEILTAIGTAAPTPETITQIPLLRRTLSESMRLLPPVWTLGRQNQQPITLSGFHLPKKCTILAPQFVLHRDPRFFPNPLEFQPDRWLTPTHSRHAYFPFSTGPRNCIGEAFAWLEMSLALTLLLQHFTFTLPKDSPTLLLSPSITLRPSKPVELLISPI